MHGALSCKFHNSAMLFLTPLAGIFCRGSKTMGRACQAQTGYHSLFVFVKSKKGENIFYICGKWLVKKIRNKNEI